MFCLDACKVYIIGINGAMHLWTHICDLEVFPQAFRRDRLFWLVLIAPDDNVGWPAVKLDCLFLPRRIHLNVTDPCCCVEHSQLGLTRVSSLAQSRAIYNAVVLDRILKIHLCTLRVLGGYLHSFTIDVVGIIQILIATKLAKLYGGLIRSKIQRTRRHRV